MTRAVFAVSLAVSACGGILALAQSAGAETVITAPVKILSDRHEPKPQQVVR